MNDQSLTPTSMPRKIDLADEMANLGVDVPLADEFSIPEAEPVFLPYQQRWFEDESQIMIAEKSRRTGLTWAESGRNVITAAKPRRRGGRNVFYVGSKQEMALEYIAACALFARAFNELAEADVYEQTFWDSKKKEEILAYMIRFPNSRFKIQALSSRPSNLRGLQGDVVIDEAAFHESLEELIKAALALTMWGARVRLISTHNGVDNLFNQYIQDARAGKLSYSVHRITLEDAVRDGLYKRICYVTGKPWTPQMDAQWIAGEYAKYPNKVLAEEELGCVPKKSGGTYLSRVAIEQAMTKDHSLPIVRLTCDDKWMEWTPEQRHLETMQFCEQELKPLLAKLNPDHVHYFGEDFARKGDLSVFVPLEVTRSLRKKVPFIVEIKNAPYEVQKAIMMYIISRLPRFRAAAFDATGNGGYLAETAALKYGTQVVDRVDLSAKWYAEWMPKLKAEFDDFNLILPRHQSVLDDLGQITVVNGVPHVDKGRTKDTDGAKGDKRHGDIAVALLMAVRASWMEGSTIEFTELPGKDRQSDNDDDNDFNFERGAW
ncbi:hypothetical protein [Vibrio quintilis]|uniref:Terminase-like family protein n=1 Tax=Vibrio quintilis TaxID=1117707 RepID=A0A1M7Z1N0_9VIBR|nr:hypothetical protein [Vibrio quintilis]SHO58783.1 hypothetical protein VQ7734_04555 [Vibrio quintilis]